MPAISAGVVAAVAGGIGAATAVVGSIQQSKAAKQANRAQERAERLRAAQMDLEAKRQKRAVIRQALIAQGQAVSNANAQGASEGSGLAGGLGQISSSAASSIGSIQQAQGLGEGMFQANSQLSSARTKQATGAGLSSLGNALFSNQQQIGRIGSYGLNKFFS